MKNHKQIFDKLAIAARALTVAANAIATAFDMATEAMNKQTEAMTRLTISDIKAIVADYYNVTGEDMTSQSRRREFVVARQTAMYFCCELLMTGDNPATLKKIGLAFGGRDHSTVIYAVNTVNDLIDTDISYKAEVLEIKMKINSSYK